MKINKNKQQEAQDKATELIASQERKRTETRLVNLEQALEQGKSEVLLNNEFMENLPDLIASFCQNDEKDRIARLIARIGESTWCEDVRLLGEFTRGNGSKLRERAVMALSLCLSGLQSDEHSELINQIIVLLLQWLRMETDFLSVCSPVCKQLQTFGIRLLEEGLWQKCDPILDVFYKIQSGKLQKSNAIRSIVARAQDAMAQDHTLEELTLISLKGRGERKAIAEKTLLHLGRNAATHLLKTLIASQEKEDRLRLVQLIPATGYVSVLVLKKYLGKELPWYAIRNIILMIGEMDNPELLSLVLPFFKHDDVRVQQQLLDCIFQVGAEDKGNYLLAAMDEVNDELKPQLVEYLGKTSEPGSMDLFLDLLAQRDEISSHIRDELLQALAVQVRLSDSIRAVNLLTFLVEERGEHHDLESDPVAKVALQSLHILNYRFKAEGILEEPEEELPSDESLDEVSFDGDPAIQGNAKRTVNKINEQVASLLGKDKVSEASQLLYEKCVEAAMMKDFAVAEMLIDRILEVDPNAMALLIRAGERIEEEKSTAVSGSHVSIWQELYDTLTTEEFNALYYGMKQKQYSPGSLIAAQGASSPVLYFINSGQAKLTYQREKEEIFLKRIGPGEIVGGVSFFDVSVWTVALTALEHVALHVLDRETYLNLIENYPSLKNCLVEFCQKNESVPELLQMSGEDRRRSVRYPVARIVKHMLMNREGGVSTRGFKGELVDISTGGLSFYIKISRQENARLLLGRNIQSNIPVDEEEIVACRGQIVAVRFQQDIERNYTVHVQVDTPLKEDDVKRIANK